jgi:hypothetical protein
MQAGACEVMSIQAHGQVGSMGITLVSITSSSIPAFILQQQQQQQHRAREDSRATVDAQFF